MKSRFRLSDTILNLKGLPKGYRTIHKLRETIRAGDFERFYDLCYKKIDWEAGFSTDKNYGKFVLSDLCQDVVTYVKTEKTQYFEEIFDYINRMSEDSESTLQLKAANYNLFMMNSKLHRQVVDQCDFNALCKLAKTAIFVKNDEASTYQFRSRYSMLDMVTYDTIRKSQINLALEFSHLNKFLNFYRDTLYFLTFIVKIMSVRQLISSKQIF